MIDGIVMSNINPAQIDKRMDALRSKFAGPICRLWQPRFIGLRRADSLAA